MFVVWNDETPSLTNLQITKPKNIDVALGTLDILLATSRDGGSTFEVSNLNNSPENSWNPRISIYENNVYVVWNEKIDSNDEIFFAASTDDGKSFSKPVNLSKTAASSKDAGIRAFGNNVYVIWQEAGGGTSNIFFTKSDNNGASFSSPVKISNDGAAELTRDTQMGVSDNNLFIVWYDRLTKNGVFFVKSDNYGQTFSTPINLSGKVPNIQMAQIAGFEDSLYVIWQDNRLGNSDVFLRRSNDQGQSFGSILNLSNDISESKLSILGPQIAAVNQNVYTVFEKMNENGSDLFLQRTQSGQLKNGTLVLQTINHEISVEVGIDKSALEPEIPYPLTMKFFESATGKLLENVTYSFSIEDVSGNIIVDHHNQLAQDGYDTQVISFPETGPFTITISVEGVGDALPYENKYSGAASAVITVVPEFPFGIILVMIFAIIFTIIISKLKHYQSFRQNFI